MSIRILTKNAVDNTNIDGARQNHFNAGMQSGIVKGALNEGEFFAITSNEIALDTCELRLCGHQVVIDDLQALTLLNKPTQPTKYSMIAEISVSDTSVPTFKLFIQPESTALIQDNLFKSASGRGTYQLRIGNFTLGTTGLISDVVRTTDVITGGGEGASIEVEFNATAEQLSSSSEPEAHIDYNEETKKYDVHFGIPAGEGTNVLIGGVGQKDWSADFVEEEKLKSETNGAITHNGDDAVMFAESERQKSETDGAIVHENNESLVFAESERQKSEIDGAIVHENNESLVFAESEREKTLNLYPIIQNTFTSRGLTFSILDDGTLHITGTTNSAGSISLVQDLPTFKSGKSYTFSMQNLVASTSGGGWDISIVTPNGNLTVDTNNTSHTKSFNSDTNATDSVFYINSSGITVDISCKLMLNEGANALNFVSYNGAIVHEKDIQKHIITAMSETQFVLSAINTYEIIPLTTNKAQVGTKLTLNNNGTIIIGSGVSYIKGSAFINIAGSTNTGDCYIKISKNNELTVLARVYISGNSSHNLQLTDFLIPVEENDIISLQAHVNNINNKIGDRTYMTVEVVE